MNLLGLLESRRDEVLHRWASLALAVYPEGSEGFLGREQDRFRNPVGHLTGQSLAALLDALLAGDPAEAAAEPLEGIVRVRAIQDLSPSEGVGFVFLLKRVVRDELGEAVDDRSCRAELRELDERIDRLALAAFDRFVRCREAIFDLRAREAKRRTWSLLKRLEELPGATGAAAPPAKGGDGA
jgi:hypothetical protein